MRYLHNKKRPNERKNKGKERDGEAEANSYREEKRRAR